MRHFYIFRILPLKSPRLFGTLSHPWQWRTSIQGTLCSSREHCSKYLRWFIPLILYKTLWATEVVQLSSIDRRGQAQGSSGIALAHSVSTAEPLLWALYHLHPWCSGDLFVGQPHSLSPAILSKVNFVIFLTLTCTKTGIITKLTLQDGWEQCDPCIYISISTDYFKTVL